MPHLLVTGGAGFIGTNYVYRHVKAYPEDKLYVLDALHYAGHQENLQPLIDRGQIVFIKGDIRDEALLTDLLFKERIDWIVNFAAHTHVDRSIADPRPFYENNVAGLCALLQAAVRVFVDKGRGGRLHQVSTDEVYGSLGPDEAPWDESAPLQPNSPYAASKASGDLFVRAFAHTYGLKATISRCSNNYGPFQHQEKFLPTALRSLLYGHPVPVYGDGAQVRDWLYVDRHCAAIDLIVAKGRPGDIYNVGGGTELKNLDFLKLLYALLNDLFYADAALASRFPVSFMARGVPFAETLRHVTDRPGHDRRYALSGAALNALGALPAAHLRAGLTYTVLWYIEHENWLSAP